uniref:RanBP2-type domain-containing protein n=1 Tax=Syphacia muris TaxID=451379 RepID=A0A0N5AHV2_9BILA
MHHRSKSGDASTTNNSYADSPERRKYSIGLTRFFLKRNKKCSGSDRMFVPATFTSHIAESTKNNDFLHPSPFFGGTVRSVSSESYHRGSDAAEFNRQVSEPQLDVTYNSLMAGPSNQRSSSSPKFLSNVFEPLVINTGNGETAGLGLDYVTSFSPQSYNESPVERLARIRSVFDEKTRILNVVKDDIANLKKFIVRYGDEKSAKFSNFYEYLTEDGRRRLDAEICCLEEELDRLRKECPKVVPPKVPPMKNNKWTCLQCTSCNPMSEYRCRSCGLPSTELKSMIANVNIAYHHLARNFSCFSTSVTRYHIMHRYSTMSRDEEEDKWLKMLDDAVLDVYKMADVRATIESCLPGGGMHYSGFEINLYKEQLQRELIQVKEDWQEVKRRILLVVPNCKKEIEKYERHLERILLSNTAKSTKTWRCMECQKVNDAKLYRCKCGFPRLKIDPMEKQFCTCDLCIPLDLSSYRKQGL